MATAEKREHELHASQAQIMFSKYCENPYCFYGAEVLNYSASGMYLASHYQLEPGTILNLRKAAYGVDSMDLRTDEIQWGRVVWGTKLPNSSKFGYGISTIQMGSTDSRDLDRVAQLLGTTDPVGTDIPLEPAQIACENPMCQITQLELKQAKETAESRAKKLEILNRFASALSSTLDLGRILRIVCKEMLDIFGSRNAGIGVLNEDKTKLTMVAFYADREEEGDITGMEMPIVGNAATIHVIKHGETIIVPDVQHNPVTASYHDIAFVRGTKCVMIVPLLARGEVIGTIGLPTSDESHIYSPADVTLAQTIASQITGVIGNARTHEDTQKARKHAEQELKIGRDIQTGFLPESLPCIPGWEVASHFKAARMVAGDFYDIFSLENGGKMGLVIADVCDKGVGAALYMALFRTLIRASMIHRFTDNTIETDACPRSSDDILQNTIRLTNNYIATTHGEANMFATMFLGILDPQTGSVSYANGGHEAPLIIRDHEIREELKSTGPAVGMFPNTDYRVRRFQMDVGDILFGYTDGLPDAQNRDGEFYGHEKVQALLTQGFPSANQMVNRIVTNVNRHILDAEQFDDMAILAIQRV